MTLEEFKDVYKDKTPLEKLALMTVQFDYWRNDTKDRADANWRGNFDEAAYYAGECEAMKARIEWLYGELSNALQAQEPRVMTAEETQRARFAWLEVKNKPVFEPALIMTASAEKGIITHIAFITIYGEITLPNQDYNIVFRCWTSRPTDAQREAEPWQKELP